MEEMKSQFTNIYVKNLDPEVTQEEFVDLFEQFGRVTSAVVQIDDEGNGTCVAPAAETVQDTSYPLARPLFIYPSKAALEKPQVRAFVEYIMSDEGLALVEEVDYFPATAEQIAAARQMLSGAE